MRDEEETEPTHSPWKENPHNPWHPSKELMAKHPDYDDQLAMHAD